MRNKVIVLILICLPGLRTECQENEFKEVAKTKTFYVLEDGFIINSKPRTERSFFTGGQGEELRIGWTKDGHAMRTILTFDISAILPKTNEEITIFAATLKVYESNTNLHPFDAENEKRTVNVYLMRPADREMETYDRSAVSCGIIAKWGYNVLEEYKLEVTKALSEYYLSNTGNINKVQFRLQFTNDKNVTSKENSALKSSMWSIFAKEYERENYRAQLVIKYNIEEKEEE